MAPPKRPWFRLYVEIINDPKLRRRPTADRWLWITVLCVARASPVAGRLMVTERSAATIDDLADMANIPVKTAKAAMRCFEAEGMVEHDSINEAWCVPKFLDRQYESDNSTERSRKHRQWNADAAAMQRPINGQSSVDETESSSEEDSVSLKSVPLGEAALRKIAEARLARQLARGVDVPMPEAWLSRTISNLRRDKAQLIDELGDDMTLEEAVAHLDPAKPAPVAERPTVPAEESAVLRMYRR